MEHVFKYDAETAVVETQQGKVRGYVYDHISIFKGIPYAEAKRFHSPEPVKRWEGVLDATNYGYVCPLLDAPKPMGELTVPHRYWPTSEACQNLNIWTPACDSGKRPVMVWLHGGGYEAGSAIEQLAYEGENMCRFGQVVVVSVNQRLNVLGYCDLSAFGEEYADSGNAGTNDIIAALQWVHDNIAAFGGDPENVTVFGQSGGGAKVTTLLQTPAADGLYAKGINMSGVVGPLLADSKGNGEDLVRAMMKELDITDVKELETVSYERLAYAYKKVKPELQKGTAFKDLKLVLKHVELFPNIIAWIMASMGYGMMFSTSVYYMMYYWARPDLISAYMGVISIGALISMVVLMPIVLKICKTGQKALMLSQATSIVCYVILFFFGKTNFIFLCVVTFISSCFSAMQNALVNVLVNDSIDYIQYKEGLSANGVISSIKGFAGKAGGTVVSSGIMAVLAASGYVAGAVGQQPEATMFALNFLKFGAPSLTGIILIICVKFNPVEKYEKEIEEMKRKMGANNE